MNVILIQWGEQNWFFDGKSFRASIFYNECSLIVKFSVLFLTNKDLLWIAGFEFSTKLEKLFIRHFASLAGFHALKIKISDNERLPETLSMPAARSSVEIDPLEPPSIELKGFMIVLKIASPVRLSSRSHIRRPGWYIVSFGNASPWQKFSTCPLTWG